MVCERTPAILDATRRFGRAGPRLAALSPWPARKSASLQPGLRVDRRAPAAHFETERRLVVTAGIPDRADHVAGRDRLADLAEDLVVVAVQAHVPAAVVDHDHQAHAGQPVAVDDPAGVWRPYARAAVRPD